MPAAPPSPTPGPTPRRRGFARLLARLGPLVGLGYYLSFGRLSRLERSLLYPAQHMQPREELELPPGAERWWFEHPLPGEAHAAEATRTAAHFYPGDGRSAGSPGPAVLFAHGNAEFIEDYQKAFPLYREAGLSVLLVEYRGCGHSSGEATRENLREDHRHFFDRLAADPRVDPERVVLHGRSMGGGIASELAAERPAAAALILESTYSSIADIAAALWVPRSSIRDNWDVTAAIRAYPGPVMIFHSEEDEVIPHALSQRNLAARPDATYVSLPVGHLEPMPPEFFEHAIAFLRSAGVLAGEEVIA